MRASIRQPDPNVHPHPDTLQLPRPWDDRCAIARASRAKREAEGIEEDEDDDDDEEEPSEEEGDFVGEKVVESSELLCGEGFAGRSKVRPARTRNNNKRTHWKAEYLEDLLTPLSAVEFFEYSGGIEDSHGFTRLFAAMSSEGQEHIHWYVPEARFWEAGKFSLQYGNEARVDATYCAAAMLVTIPQWQERDSKGEK